MPLPITENPVPARFKLFSPNGVDAFTLVDQDLGVTSVFPLDRLPESIRTKNPTEILGDRNDFNLLHHIPGTIIQRHPANGTPEQTLTVGYDENGVATSIVEQVGEKIVFQSSEV